MRSVEDLAWRQRVDPVGHRESSWDLRWALPKSRLEVEAEAVVVTELEDLVKLRVFDTRLGGRAWPDAPGVECFESEVEVVVALRIVVVVDAVVALVSFGFDRLVVAVVEDAFGPFEAVVAVAAAAAVVVAYVAVLAFAA